MINCRREPATLQEYVSSCKNYPLGGKPIRITPAIVHHKGTMQYLLAEEEVSFQRSTTMAQICICWFPFHWVYHAILVNGLQKLKAKQLNSPGKQAKTIWSLLPFEDQGQAHCKTEVNLDKQHVKCTHQAGKQQFSVLALSG